MALEFQIPELAGIRMPNARSLSNLKPARRGEIRNPAGRNQYSYRATAEETFAELLRAVDPVSRKTTAELIISSLIKVAREGDRWAMDRVLERILPRVERQEIRSTTEVTADGLADQLEAIARKIDA